MVLTAWDLILPPFYIFLILIIADIIRKKNQELNPAYHYYVYGLLAKIIGAITLCLIYQFYYRGGDTVNYFRSSVCILNIFGKDQGTFFDILSGGNTPENYSYFDSSTGYPPYWGDKYSDFVARFMTPICFLGAKSFIPSAIILAWLCYTGIWRLYLLFSEQFPGVYKKLAISILFFPSVLFWGSGILKDSITISAVGWYAYSFNRLLVKKNYSLFNIFALITSAYLLISIKPYILFALLPGSLIWLSNEKLVRIKNKFFKALVTPLVLAIGVSIGFVALTEMGDVLGTYALNNVMHRAVETQSDLKQDYYGGNTFDIGSFDPSVGGMLSKAHLAIAAGLFRPYLWDVKNPVMLLSALENSYILVLTIFLVLKIRVVGFLRLISKNPLLLFSILFSLFFAFSVGISTPNFGSLVRLRIPCLPFFVSSLFVLQYLYQQKRKD